VHQEFLADTEEGRRVSGECKNKQTGGGNEKEGPNEGGNRNSVRHEEPAAYLARKNDLKGERKTRATRKTTGGNSDARMPDRLRTGPGRQMSPALESLYCGPQTDWVRCWGKKIKLLRERKRGKKVADRT